MISPDLEKTIFETTSPWYVESKIGCLAPEDLEFLRQYSTIETYDKNDVIIKSDTYIDKLYYINQGLIRCTLANSNGEEKTVYYNDRFIALECFFHRQPCAYKALAMKAVEVYAVDRKNSQFILEQKNIRDLIIKALSFKCRVLGWQVDDLSLCNPLEKVCRLLCCYISTDTPEQIIQLTHQELASLTGLHRVTITNNISKLKQLGLIQVNKDGHIVVLNWKALKEIGFDGRF